jgi:ribosomal protein S13
VVVSKTIHKATATTKFTRATDKATAWIEVVAFRGRRATTPAPTRGQSTRKGRKGNIKKLDLPGGKPPGMDPADHVSVHRTK